MPTTLKKDGIEASPTWEKLLHCLFKKCQGTDLVAIKKKKNRDLFLQHYLNISDSLELSQLIFALKRKKKKRDSKITHHEGLEAQAKMWALHQVLSAGESVNLLSMCADKVRISSQLSKVLLFWKQWAYKYVQVN